MIPESTEYLSADDAAKRLGVSVRRVYDLIKAGRLRARTFAGRHLIDPSSVEARRSHDRGAGRPMSPRRAWALILLNDGRDPEGLDAITKSKLRRVIRERNLWEMRSKLASRAERLELRAHPSDLKRIEAEPGLVRTSARYAAQAGLRLHSPDAPLEFYADRARSRDLIRRYRLVASAVPNVVLHVVPSSVRHWLVGPVAPPTAVALDLADQPDARSRDTARALLART